MLADMETQLGSDDATNALNLVTSSRSTLAEALVTPRWYHPALGLLVGALLAAQAIPSLTVRNLMLVPYALGLIALVLGYRRQTGVMINGLRPRSGRPWAVALIIVLLVLFIGGIGLRMGLGWSWSPVVAGGLAFVAVIAFGRRFDTAVRAGLRRQT